MPALRPAQPASRALVLGLALIGVGTAFAVLSILADWLGISGGGEGFGYQQLIVLIISVVVILIGIGIVVQPAIERSRTGRDGFESDP